MKERTDRLNISRIEYVVLDFPELDTHRIVHHLIGTVIFLCFLQLATPYCCATVR